MKIVASAAVLPVIPCRSRARAGLDATMSRVHGVTKMGDKATIQVGGRNRRHDQADQAQRLRNGLLAGRCQARRGSQRIGDAGHAERRRGATRLQVERSRALSDGARVEELIGRLVRCRPPETKVTWT